MEQSNLEPQVCLVLTKWAMTTQLSTPTHEDPMERVRKHHPTKQADPPQGHLRASGTKHLSYEVLGSCWHLRSQNHWPWQKGARFYRIPSPQKNGPVVKTTSILPRGHTVFLPYPECSLPVDRTKPLSQEVNVQVGPKAHLGATGSPPG